jgi:hypothetical protein
MNVVGHEHVRVHGALVLRARRLEVFEEVSAVSGARKHRPAVVTALNDVLRLARKAIAT